jgi:small ligand-binding sensory domain FIST
VRFCLRDAGTAYHELAELLAGRQAGAALTFVCTARGSRLFDARHRDTSTIERAIGPVPVGGMFSAGEIGPVGGQSFLLTNSATLALLHDRKV